MCRMLVLTGYAEALEYLLLKFQTLSIYGKSIDKKGHEDGWGIGYYNCEGVHLSKKAECALKSEDYLNLVRKVTCENPSIVMAHLRKATPGTQVTDREAHPFLDGDSLFCHNGSLWRADGSPLGEDLDSLILFRRIQETSFKDALLHFRNYNYTSLTCLLTDGHTVWAYRDYREREEYYTLYYLKGENFILFCSEPICTGEWTLMKKGELVTVFQTLDMETDLILG
ncbi:MAG: class II glutamine amidotransferase [Theionarchaea archaeon]|nr:class II glutamine amidotransferase [Theionarchaea archaeon]